MGSFFTKPKPKEVKHEEDVFDDPVTLVELDTYSDDDNNIYKLS